METDNDAMPPLSEIPMPTAKEEWMAKYVICLMEHGFSADESWAIVRACGEDHDYESDPSDAANADLEYWTDDGELG